MAFVPSISVSQLAATPNIVSVTDDSTGSDIAIVSRVIYVQTASGSYLVPSGTTTDFTAWALVLTTIPLDILTQDECVNIITNWLDINGATLYTYENQYPLAEYNKQFLAYLVAASGLTPGIVQDSNYSGNIAVFWTNVVAGINQVNFARDISGGQSCFNRATYMRLNQSLYF